MNLIMETSRVELAEIRNDDSASSDRPNPILTNESVFDLRKTCETDSACLLLLKEKFSLNVPDSVSDSTRKKIGLVSKTVKDLKKGKKFEKLKKYLSTPFELPKQKEQVQLSIPSKVAKQIAKLETTLNSKNNELHCAQEIIDDLQEDNKSARVQFALKIEKETEIFTNKLSEQTEKVSSQEFQIHELKETIGVKDSSLKKSELEIQQLQGKLEKKCRKIKEFDIRNTNRNLKRKDERLEKLVEENKRIKVEVKNLQETNVQLQKALSDVKCRHIANLKMKSKLKLRLKRVLCAHSGSSIDEMQAASKKLEDENKELLKYVEFLEESSVPEEISTFQDGRYTTMMREVCMTLLTECNVSINKLPKAIEVVLSTFTGTTVSKTPSAATLSRLMTEANILANNQVVKEMLAGDGPTSASGNVLHQDATTKFHKHYEGMQVTLESGKCLSMGLRQLAGGDAKTYVAAFNDIIDGLVASCKNDDKKTRAQLVTSFKAFMNDRCAVNGVFCEQISKLREDLLPTVIENFDELPEEEREEIIYTGKFACQMHLLSNFATAAEKGAFAVEQCLSDLQNPHTMKKAGGSEGVNLVVTAAKAFSERGCDKSGVNEYFESFLRGRGKKNAIKTFLGHRFNMLFSDAAAVYYHHLDILDFLKTWPNPNQLLQSVMFDINKDMYLSICRALGMIGKLVGEPLEAILKCKKHILDLNDTLLVIQESLSMWAQDGSIAMAGLPLFKDFTETKCAIFEALFKETNVEFESLTATAIEIICGHILILLERQAADQLPGGELWEPSEKLKKVAACVPPTNMASERDMAKLDNLVRAKPSCTIESLETQIMWQTNKTSQWLNLLNDDEKNSVMEMARLKAPEMRKRVVERRERLKDSLTQQLLKKQQIVKEKEEKKVGTKLELTRKLESYGGLWKKSDIQEKVDQFKSAKQAREAIMSQIKFYKFVLEAKGDKILFQESSGGQTFSIAILVEHLMTIVELNCGCEDGLELVSEVERKDDKKEENEKDGDYMVQKTKAELVEQRMEGKKKRINCDQVKTLYALYCSNPEMIVSREFEMKRKAGGGVSVEWCNGKVVHVVKSQTDKSIYCVQLNHHDDLLNVKLLLEMKKGNVIFL